MKDTEDIVHRLLKRAEIRRQIKTRKSVIEGKPDRIADLLEEAAGTINELRAVITDRGSMINSRAYHPIEFEDTVPLMGKECLCANSEEGLGYWATFIGIDRDSEFPYVCKVYHDKRIRSFKWIAINQ